MDISIKIKDTVFANPILLASGTFGYGSDFVSVINQVGGFITKGITLAPRIGNPAPRIYELPGAILNSVGLENPGALDFRNKILPRLNFSTPLIVNIAGFDTADFSTIVKILDCDRIAGFEINISCPNVKTGGAIFGQDPKLTEQIVTEVRRATKKLVITKLTANFIDPVNTAQAAESAGTDAISLINTLYGLAIDLKEQKYFLGGKTGGLSGPAIKPFALFCVERVSKAIKIPVIGGGGIVNATDVCEFMLAGASLVQIGSLNLINPFAAFDILKDLKKYMKIYKIKAIRQIIGKVRSNDDKNNTCG
ncbi:MAG: dihydroorotate dehydrogenase [candidate division WOR-3 bacterium]|nr:dihydroorotate dehydrogenase [candidate division WOR-3 bacterium]MDH5683486.1 dihydroorotate dehydrogenase [candidate division WOR-3 bacterium]